MSDDETPSLADWSFLAARGRQGRWMVVGTHADTGQSAAASAQTEALALERCRTIAHGISLSR